MYPLLFKIGPVPIHTYGFLIAIGYLLCVLTIQKLSVRSKVSPNVMVDFSFWMLVSGFLGARALFVVTRFDYFAKEPLAMFKVWEGGLVFYGGLIAALPVGVWFVKKHGINVWKGIDIAFPGLVVAHALGRFGCFAAGCCYGKPTGTDWGLKFQSPLVDAHLRGINIHPTQLYEAFSLLILYAGLLYVFKNKKFDGQAGLTYLIAYPIIRSVIEIYRGDLIRGFVIPNVLSTSQFISIFIALGAGVALWVRLSQTKEN